MADFLQQLQQLAIFTQIRNSTPLYAGLLWLHLAALIVWGAAIFRPDDLRRIKHVSLGVAAIGGLLLFGAKAAEYAYNPWFWVKLVLLALLAGISPLRRSRPRLATGLAFLLLTAMIAAARGPATVKDTMGSMVDPTADFLFESVQILSDETGIHEIVPRTDAEWQEVRSRAETLRQAQDVLSAPGLRGARPRDRAANPEVENQAAEIQTLLDANRADFATRARGLAEAAEVVIRAADAKDKDALLQALEGIDRACERCHLTYWYPRDQRARQAAKEAGIIE